MWTPIIFHSSIKLPASNLVRVLYQQCRLSWSQQMFSQSEKRSFVQSWKFSYTSNCIQRGGWCVGTAWYVDACEQILGSTKFKCKKKSFFVFLLPHLFIYYPFCIKHRDGRPRVDSRYGNIIYSLRHKVESPRTILSSGYCLITLSIYFV
jgi:hypothetical protein